MKISRKMAAGLLVLTMAATTLCSCRPTQNDKDEITKIPEEFVEAFKADDDKKLESLAKGYEYEDIMDFVDTDTEKEEEIYHKILSFTEVTETEEPVIDKKNRTAKMDIEITYFDIEELNLMSEEYMTYDEYVEILEAVDGSLTKKFTVGFVYDNKAKEWLMDKRSARKLGKFFASFSYNVSKMVEISTSDAEDLMKGLMDDLASGNFDGLPSDFDWNSVSVYEYFTLPDKGVNTQEALERFASEYIKYVNDHDPVITCDQGMAYTCTVSGKAPSQEELASVLMTDEFLVPYYMDVIRCTKLNMTTDELIDSQGALVYNTLADAIPDCGSETYKLEATIPYYYTDGDQIILLSDLIIDPETELIESGEISQEQYLRCMEQAIINLYENGEITEELYEGMLASLEDEAMPYEPDTSVSPSGYENQAVDAYEYVPDWCDDGSIIYGSSKKDENGYIMHYSEVSDYTVATIGYTFSDDGVRITCYFDEPLPMGDSFIVEWWVEEEDVTDSQVFLVQMNNMHEVEVFLSNEEFAMGDYIEMRIWESDHSHVVSYVQLYT